MRVLDSVERFVSNESLIRKMGGRKNKKQASTPSDSTSKKASVTTPAVNGEKAEGCENSPSGQCRHLKSSVNLAQVRKKMKDCRNFQCEECRKSSKSSEAKQDGELQEEADVYCCLACGHLGCGRDSDEKHALEHYTAPRSGPHAIVVNVRTLLLWCYECDNEIAQNSLASLKEITELIGRQVKNVAGSASQSIANGGKSAVTAADVKGTPVKTRANIRSSIMPADMKGLSNLGNTCFFNAVMQNMAQTHILQILLNDTQSFRKGAVFSVQPASKHESESGGSLPPLQFTIERDPDLLTSSFCSFLSEFHQTGKSSILNPGTLFGQVCKKAPRFRGFQQQDSHELLRYMLDALKIEETRRLRVAVVRHFGLDLENLDKQETVDSKLKYKLKAYDVNNLTFVEQVFGGHLLQVIECLQCSHVSKRHEPFLDLSLPIVDMKTLAAKKDSGDLKVLERNEKKDFKPSKHQQKKAKAQSRKQAKAAKRRGSTAEEVQKDGQGAEENTNEANGNAVTDGDEITQLADGLASKLTVNGSGESRAVEGGQMEKTIDSGNATFTVSEKGASNDNLPIAVECNGDNGLKSSGSEDEQDEEAASLKEDRTSERDSIDQAGSAVEPLNPDETATNRLECTLASCLRQFTAMELLNGKNKFGCVNCAKVGLAQKNNSEAASHMANGNGVAEEPKRHRKDSNPVVYTDARKRYLIYSPPAVLTLHLKRFHQVGTRMQKISKHVEFPLTLDISPYCCKNGNRYNPAQKRVLYSLYGIVCHSGGLSGGHYVAYVKVRPKDEKLAMAFVTSSTSGDSNIDGRNGVNENESHAQLENGAQSENGRMVPTPADGKWYFVSDTQVSEVPESKVLAAEAYLLFYERIF